MLRIICAISIVYFAICLIYKGSGYNNQYYVLSTIATFLYGIFLAFTIYNNQSRFSRIRELLRNDDSNLLLMYRQGRIFGEENQKKIKEHIDKYLIGQIDYRLEDFSESTSGFNQLQEFILELEPKNNREAVIYQNLLTALADSAKNRSLVSSLVSQKVTQIEWFSIVGLQTLIAIFILILNNSSVVSAILSTLLVSVSLIMILVLYQIDQLSWQEDKWIWQPLHKLFLELELIPYYSEQVISSGRARITKGEKVRIAHYPNFYPDMNRKTVELKTIG